MKAVTAAWPINFNSVKRTDVFLFKANWSLKSKRQHLHLITIVVFVFIPSERFVCSYLVNLSQFNEKRRLFTVQRI